MAPMAKTTEAPGGVVPSEPIGDRSPTSRTAPSLFERYHAQDIVDLIASYPLAWVVAADGDAHHASLLPLLSERDADGHVVSLLGHLARTNALFDELRRAPKALILFTGPHGYISPASVSDRCWAPTWNYAQVRIEADIHFDEQGIDSALETLVDAMERGRENPWRIAEMGARYAGMAGAVIAFRATIGRLEGRFKLGQDEKPATLAEILARRPDDDLSHWMRRFNRARLGCA